MKTPPPDRRPAVPATSPWTAAALVAVAVVSAVALDGLQSLRGGPAYLFSPRIEIAEEEPPRKPLAFEIREGLAASGFPAESPSPLPPEDGPEEIAVLVTADFFENSASAFETDLAARTISIDARDPVLTDAFSGIRMHVRGEDGGRLHILFLWPTEKKPAKEEPPIKKIAPPKPGKVALVVDDMGSNLKALDALIGLEQRLTVAILPYGPYAAKTAEIARKNGLEVILHLPLESLNAHESEAYTQGLIRADMSRRTIRRMMEDNLDRVPHIRGVNNHMGSKGTADAPLMRLILTPIKERNLFFLDSMTSNRSVAANVAREMGIPTATRQVFLDDGGDVLSVKERLDELFRQARANGSAVGICHPHPQTLEALQEHFRRLDVLGLEAVYVSEIVRR